MVTVSHGPMGADLDRTKSLVSFRLSMSLHSYLCAIVAKMTFPKKIFLCRLDSIFGSEIECKFVDDDALPAR